MINKLIYVTSVPIDGKTGQNSFERQFIDELSKAKNQDFHYKVFCASENHMPSEENVNFIKIKKNYLGFIVFQIKLFFSLLRETKRRKNIKYVMFIRYHPSMFVPYLISKITPVELVIRTGPILPNLKVYNKNPNPISYFLIKLFVNLHYKTAKNIITVTDKIKQWVIEESGISSANIKIIPNGVDTKLFKKRPSTRKELGLPEHQTLGCFFGNIYEDQGLDIVIEALGHLKKMSSNNQVLEIPKIVIIGGGESVDYLKTLAQELGVSEYLIWIGAIKQSQIPEILSVVDFTLATFKNRAFATTGSAAIKLVESLAMDLPIIASRGSGHEFIEEEDFGVTVEPENVEALANVLIDPKYTNKKLGGRGRNYVKEYRSEHKMVSDILTVCFEEKL